MRPDEFLKMRLIVINNSNPRVIRHLFANVNQGAWHQVQHYLLGHMGLNQTLLFALRPSSASPAVGYLAKHNFQQKELIEAAFR